MGVSGQQTLTHPTSNIRQPRSASTARPKRLLTRTEPDAVVVHDVSGYFRRYFSRSPDLFVRERRVLL